MSRGLGDVYKRQIYDTFYARSGPQWKGIGQAKAVVFCLFVVVLAVLQQKLTQSKEVQQ